MAVRLRRRKDGANRGQRVKRWIGSLQDDENRGNKRERARVREKERGGHAKDEARRKMCTPRRASARRKSSKENASGAPWCRRAARPPPDRRLSPPRTSLGRRRRRVAERRLPSGSSDISSRGRSSRRPRSCRCHVGRASGGTSGCSAVASGAVSGPAGGGGALKRPKMNPRRRRMREDVARFSSGVFFLSWVPISFLTADGFCV